MENNERKFWIDNLRWITILIVVVFHVFYYYNNIGIDPMFAKLDPNPAVEGGIAKLTFAGLFQYVVYQWFMLLLFVVSGICAKYSLKKNTVKQFLKARVQKLLVPSTLGIITVQWIGGWIITGRFGTGDAPMEGPVRFVISILTGIGALWFCHVLFVACLILALIKFIDKSGKLEALGEKSNIVVAAAFYIIMFGAAQILSSKMIPTYRMAYYPMGFLAGYYVFSSEKLLEQLKKFGWIFLIAGIVAGVFYIKKFYGISYSSYEVQKDWLSVLFAWMTVLGILGISQVILEFNNSFTSYCSKAGWGVYINHIVIMLATNSLLSSVADKLPVAVIYLIELVSALVVSVACWELLRRIPVVRYVLYGVKKCSKKTS